MRQRKLKRNKPRKETGTGTTAGTKKRDIIMREQRDRRRSEKRTRKVLALEDRIAELEARVEALEG